MKKLVLTLDRNSDKRKKKRIEIFSNVFGKLDILGVSANAKIKDISYSGFGLIIPNDERLSTMETLEAKFALSNQLFLGRIANRVLLPNKEIKLGISLPIQIKKEIDFNTQDSTWDRVTDLETVENIYSDLAFKGPECPIEIRQNFSRATVIPLELTASKTLICDIFEIHNGTLDKGKARGVFDLFQTCHAFDTNIEKLDGSKIELKLSPILARLLRRETVRVKMAPSNLETSILLRSKSLSREVSEFQIFDYSEHGISLLDPTGELSLPRSLKFEEIIIDIHGFGPVFGHGEVRNYEWNREQNSHIIGLIFEPYGEPHQTNWHNFILKSRYPTLNFEYQDEDHHKIWNLFEESGYLSHLDENQNENLSHRKIESENTWQNLRDSGVIHSRRIMYKKNAQVAGHLQLDQYYKDSWCVHHLAISKESSKIIAKDIYSAMTDFLSSRKTKYIVTYHRPDLAWNQRNYHDFVKNYQYKNHNFMELFNLYDFKISDKFDQLENLENDDIRIANSYDLSSIFHYYSNMYPSFVLEALNIEQGLMKLEEIESEYKHVKLVRGREFLVLVKNKEVQAFLQIEWGTHATNIFSLFDSIFVYITKEIEKNDLDRLIISAGRFLRKKGKTNALVLIRDEYKCNLESKHMKYLCDENRWIAKSATLKRYQAYAQILYGHLLTRREKIKKKNLKKSNENT